MKHHFYTRQDCLCVHFLIKYLPTDLPKAALLKALGYCPVHVLESMLFRDKERLSHR